jgi:hypothetical protein
MEDFRTQLTALIDDMLAAGDTPVFLVMDMEGVEDIKKVRGVESLEQFKQSAIECVAQATNGADAFTYGESKLIAILSAKEFDRLKTFALIQKLRRAIPLLGQSFDCFLRPECDVLEYDPQAGVAGLINQIARQERARHEQQQQQDRSA